MLDEQWSAEIKALLYRVQRQDPAALTVLYDMGANKLASLITSIVNNTHDTEEVLQEVFVGIWQNAHKYSGKGSAWGWICVLARHRAIDRLRHSSIRQQESTDANPDLLDRLSEAASTIDSHWIGQCLSQLPPQTQQVILLSYINGYSHTELSQQLSTPLGTVKAWIRRGLQELRLCLHH